MFGKLFITFISARFRCPYSYTPVSRPWISSRLDPYKQPVALINHLLVQEKHTGTMPGNNKQLNT